MYGAADERESIATIHEALERGVNLMDSGDFYGQGHNELIIGRALRDRREKALLSVKFGALRGPDGSWLGYDARPAAVKNFLAYSLKRLGVDHIDIYRPARLDPAVPIEDTIGAISELISAGYVRAIGLSEVGPTTVRRACAVHAIADLQIEYSLISRGPEERLFPTLAELGIGVTAYGVLSRGLLSGSRPGAQGDLRARLPRFTGANWQRNEALVSALEKLAVGRGVQASAACHRLGARPVGSNRARHRGADAGSARRIAESPGNRTLPRGPPPHCRGRPGIGRVGHPLRRASDALAGQRALSVVPRRDNGSGSEVVKNSHGRESVGGNRPRRRCSRRMRHFLSCARACSTRARRLRCRTVAPVAAPAPAVWRACSRRRSRCTGAQP